MKKIIYVILLINIILISGCSQRMDSYILTRDIEQKNVNTFDTVTINYKDELVTKQVFEEEYVLESGDSKVLQGYKDNIEHVYSQDMFNVDGFEFSTELKERSFKVITTIDYKRIKIDKLSNEAKRFFFVERIVDENGEMPINELVDYYVEENGFAIDIIDS